MTTLNDNARAALDRVLDIDHRAFAVRIGLVRGAEPEMREEDIRSSVLAIDDLSWSHHEESKSAAVLLIALTWEHAPQSAKETLREFFILSLSRIGVSPAAVMLDASFKETGKYAALSSYRAELATSLLQAQYSEVINGREFGLTEFQWRLLQDSKSNPVIGVSAPTSAGKSFAIGLVIVRHAIRSSMPIVYIVPTISLVNQVCDDLRRLFEEFSLDWAVSTTFNKDAASTAFVLTQEKAIGALANGLGEKKLGQLVVDEIQNLERVAGEGDVRAKIMHDFLREVADGRFAEKVILSGPRLEQVGRLAVDFFGVGVERVASTPPVANLTYSIEKVRGGFLINQHREALGTKKALKIDLPEQIKGIGGSRYTDDFHRFLSGVIEKLGDSSRNIVFSPTADQARKTANSLPGFGSANVQGRGERSTLANYISEAVHPEYDLTHSVRRGVAFHTGKVPPHARLAIEQAYKDGIIKDLVCTTTLMQGVNLPADVVVIRNPRLRVQSASDSSEAEISPYEFANLRGRAGRLMQDFVGRTLVLDENAFSSDQSDLFTDTRKSLTTGYGELFRDHEDEVLTELARPGVAQSSLAKFLANHIRQTVIRHSDDSAHRLRNVGIVVEPSALVATHKAISALDVDRKIILSNRYWDPFDLQLIKDSGGSSGISELPNDVWSMSSVAVVSEWLKFQATVSPMYYERYIGKSSDHRFLTMLALSAQSWGRETPLRKIIDDRRFARDQHERIDEQVSAIYKHVVYGVTAVLKPIVDIFGSGMALIAAFESGVYHPTTRFLLSLGLYRETAVEVRRSLLSEIVGGEGMERLIRRRIDDGFDRLDPWVQRQVLPAISKYTRGNSNG